MASISSYKTKDGERWMYKVYAGFDPATGKKKYIGKRGFNNPTAAKKAAQKLEVELQDEGYVKEENIIFKDFLETFFETYSLDAKVSSVRARRIASKRLLDYFAYVKIKDITDISYQKALNALYKEGYSKNFLDSIHTTGRMIFKKAMEQKVIKSNPTEYAKVPKKKKTVKEIEEGSEDIHFLEKEELVQFLKSVKEENEQDYLVFLVLAYSGMRIGESFALKWKDVDFKNNTISITKTIFYPTNKRGEYELLTPKTEGSIRTIIMDESVLKQLKRLKVIQNEWKLANRKHYKDQQFVFTDELGNPQNDKNFRRRFYKLKEKFNVNDGITIHSFRHTHTSLLIESGVEIPEIQERLGHSDIKTTMNIYAHLTKNIKETAAKKFSNFMNGTMDEQG